jgi:predicted RNase H-like HicB family nuclease
MSTYFALVHKDSDSAFGIEFPDLPGCFSAADELADVFRNAEVALSLYLSDAATLPRSRPIEVLRSDKTVRGELAAGAFLIAVSTALKGSTEKTSAKVASTAAKVLKDPKASKAAKSAAASALTQKAGKGK